MLTCMLSPKLLPEGAIADKFSRKISLQCLEGLQIQSALNPRSEYFLAENFKFSSTGGNNQQQSTSTQQTDLLFVYN
jgi:hypothetical protein